MWHTLLTFTALLCVAVAIPDRFRVIREWRYLNFTWPNEATYQSYTARGWYIPENNLIAGVTYCNGYLYLTIPRMNDGVPVTLTRIQHTSNNTMPALEPYPSWQSNELSNCNALQTVQNLEADSKGRLWIIDGGRTSTMEKLPIVKCNPKLIIHNTVNNVSELVYNFPPDVAHRETSFLYDLVIDESDGGYAYITDNSGLDPGIVVFSLKERRSWKIRHNLTMKAQREAVNFTVDNILIRTPINIAGIALGNNQIYYSPMSSYHMFSISTNVLKNESNSFGEYQGQVWDIGVKSSQTDGMIADDKGVIYYGLLNSSSLAMWNTSTPLETGEVIIAADRKHIEWPNSFTFDDEGNIIVLTNKLHKFIFGLMDLNEVNFRLLAKYTGSKSYIYNTGASANTTEIMGVTIATNKGSVAIPPIKQNKTNESSTTSNSLTIVAILLLLALALG